MTIKQINQFRCETCKKYNKKKQEQIMDFCPIFSAPYIVGIGGYCSLIGEMTGRVGCTSHTDHPESASGRLPDNSCEKGFYRAQ
jgi:hypothetical protein